MRPAKQRLAALVCDQAALAMVGDLGTALLVDDEELVRMGAADMLADLGYAVVEASSAEHALDTLHGYWGRRPGERGGLDPRRAVAAPLCPS